ncbi:MAG TPA: hypothetical protein VJY39_14380 [Acidisphaera sp.]|nr:hypothetical protein [Acidisphaera sp.]
MHPDNRNGDTQPGAPDPETYPPQIKITSQRSPRLVPIMVVIAVTLVLATVLLKRLGLPGYVTVPCAFALAALVAAPLIAREKRRKT